MPNYIDKDRLLKTIAERNTNTCNGSVTCLQMKRIVENIPAEDVQEIKRAEWIYRDNKRYCSRCFMEQEITGCLNFCPLCGARMYGEM